MTSTKEPDMPKRSKDIQRRQAGIYAGALV